MDFGQPLSRLSENDAAARLRVPAARRARQRRVRRLRRHCERQRSNPVLSVA